MTVHSSSLSLPFKTKARTPFTPRVNIKRERSTIDDLLDNLDLLRPETKRARKLREYIPTQPDPPNVVLYYETPRFGIEQLYGHWSPLPTMSFPSSAAAATAAAADIVRACVVPPTSQHTKSVAYALTNISNTSLESIQTPQNNRLRDLESRLVPKTAFPHAA